jgi:hypothetical protein
MKLSIILTNDWELFGDGSGDYYEIQHHPTEKLLSLLTETDAKMTFFAEVGQQWGHQLISYKENKARDIAEKWEEMVCSSVKNGNDVQLHLHPQWLDSKFENGKWSLNMELWHLSNLKPELINKVLKNGKDYFESVIRKVKPDYECICFRAGNYCIQPAENIIKELNNDGFQCDSSVTKGLFSNGFYDFINAESENIPWYISDNDINLKKESKSGIMEFPIYSKNFLHSEIVKKFLPGIYYKLFFSASITEKEKNWCNERERVKNQRYPRSARFYKTNEKKGISWYLSKIISKSAVQLDYDYLPASIFVSLIKEIFIKPELKKYEETDIFIPVIASGHIKDIHNLDNLKWIIDRINMEFKDKIEWWTLTDAVKYWRQI